MLDWGWGLGFRMLAWWLLLSVGLLAVAALVLDGTFIARHLRGFRRFMKEMRQ